MGARVRFSRLPFARGLRECARPLSSHRRPLDASCQEQQNDDRKPDRRYRVQVAQKRAATAAETRKEKAAYSERSRPPEKKSGDQQDERPTRSEFDHDFPSGPSEQRAVEIVQDEHRSSRIRDGADDPAGGGIDEGRKFVGTGARAELDFGGAAGARSGNELNRGKIRKRGAGGRELRVGGN